MDDGEKTANGYLRQLLREEQQAQERSPLKRAAVKGWVKLTFWALRVYILAMLILIGYGFFHGR